MSIWLIAAIGALLATQFVNPVLIYRFFEEIILCIKDKTKRSKNKNPKEDKSEKRSFDMGIEYPLAFFMQQLLCGGIAFIMLIIWQFLAFPDRTVLQILSTIWIPGVIHLIYSLYLMDSGGPFGYRWEGHKSDFEAANTMSNFYVGIIFALISLFLLIHNTIYEFTNPIETTITIMEEEKVPTLDVDLAETIDKIEALEGYNYKKPVKRGNKIIIPMERADDVSIVGYALIENGDLKIVEKELKYTPDQSNNRDVTWVARKVWPDKVFFSDWSFQLSDTGDVYFVRFYGEYACLRAGRDIEGIVSVNATTGEVTTYSLDEIPAWVDGVSE